MSALPADFFTKPVSEVDPEIAEVLDNELARQENTLEMIASENFVPQAVLDCQGSVLTNKYAEGYPGRRYYGGCEFVDVAEQLAIDRAKELFGAEHANVQPNGGASANAIVYSTLMEPGDTFLGMKLDHGGHLTHGMRLNFSGLYYNVVAYGVDKDTSLVDQFVAAHKRWLDTAAAPMIALIRSGGNTRDVTLNLDGNKQRLGIFSWETMPRVRHEIPWAWKPEVWYRMKLTVDVREGKAHVRGKVWERDQPEPGKWTIEFEDPTPNTEGSPALYGYATGILENDIGAEIFYDNVSVTPNKK